MQDRICLVTGATSGIGLETARDLAAQGATVIILSRNAERCAATLADIQRTTGSERLDYLVADLSSQEDIRRAAVEFETRYPRLDVLVNNAGAIFITRRQSVDGIEMTFALNHLSYFMLTLLLLDRLRQSRASRIVNVSSNSHYGASINFEDLEAKKGLHNPMRAYGQSKLANLLFTYELDRRLDGESITVNALHPGLVRTGIGRNNGLLVRIFQPLILARALSPQDGAQTSVYLASSTEVAGVSGEFFIRKKAVASSPASHNEQDARRLWEISERLTGVSFPALVA